MGVSIGSEMGETLAFGGAGQDDRLDVNTKIFWIMRTILVRANLRRRLHVLRILSTVHLWYL